MKTRNYLLRKMSVFAMLIMLLAVAGPLPLTANAAAGQDHLSQGEVLNQGQSITSQNGKYFAQMQYDGNFVVYKNNPITALWASNTAGGNYNFFMAAMQADGNFVVYGNSGSYTALWASATNYGSGSYTLEIGDDSVLRVKNYGSTVWSSSNPPISDSGWQWVFRGANPYKNINQQYSSNHTGIDTNAPFGTIIDVEYSSTSTMGNHVVITTTTTYNGRRLTVRYLHLSSINGNLSNNQNVTSATYLGNVGNTGDVYPKPTPARPRAGTHLHFDVNTKTVRPEWGPLSLSETVNPEIFFLNENFTYYN